VPNFFTDQLARQQSWRDKTASLSDDQRLGRRGGRFLSGRYSGIFDAERSGIEAYVDDQGLTPHRHLDHLLSSQAFCFNFLAPFRHVPRRLPTC
jgi:hypothetical protein